MPTLYITEYQDMAREALGQQVAAPQSPSVARQAIAITGASVQSAPFSSSTRFVRLHTDMVCCVMINENPVAVTTANRMAADQTEYFGVRPGDRVAVIQGV